MQFHHQLSFADILKWIIISMLNEVGGLAPGRSGSSFPLSHLPALSSSQYHIIIFVAIGRNDYSQPVTFSIKVKLLTILYHILESL